jgi:hypothetical protein
MIVGGRIDQVAEDLFFRPTTVDAGRSIREHRKLGGGVGEKSREFRGRRLEGVHNLFY